MPDAGSEVEVFIAVGGNIEPEAHLMRGLELLAQRTRLTGVSTFYWTEALDRPGQPRYLNGVVRVRTALPPRALKFDVLRPIEAQLGRVRGEDKFAAREIDLDVILYGSLVIAEADLRLPDPELRTRSFVLAPLAELAPALRLPDTGEAVADLSEAMPPGGVAVAEAFTKQAKERFCDESGPSA